MDNAFYRTLFDRAYENTETMLAYTRVSILIKSGHMSIKTPRWPVAILDIGSNTIRLAVYDHSNPKKAFFNEKVTCFLGHDLVRTGRLNPEAKKSAHHAVAGFMHITKALGCGSVHALATAAIRDARDGKRFVESLRRDLKAPIKIITGEQEARYSALGLLSHISDAEGMVADLGGGSLELARIGSGHVYETLTFPMGTLRLLNHGRSLPQMIEEHLEGLSDHSCANLPLYVVGGTARAIATVDSQIKDKSSKFKSYCMSRSDLLAFLKKIQKMQPDKIVREFNISPVRARALPYACLLFTQIMKKLGSSRLIITTRGLRDGYLFSLIKGQKIKKFYS